MRSLQTISKNLRSQDKYILLLFIQLNHFFVKILVNINTLGFLDINNMCDKVAIFVVVKT